LLISRTLPSNGTTCHIAPSLRLFFPNSIQAYRHFFFSEDCACNVCDRLHLPFLWLCSHDDYSPTAPAAPSLRPLVSISTLIRCEPVQVYHHHPRSRVPLDPAYHNIYPGDYLVWALPWGFEFGRFPLRAGWAIEPYFVALSVVRAVGQSVVTGQQQVLAGIIVDVV
jgi:hypothetical protein